MAGRTHAAEVLSINPIPIRSPKCWSGADSLLTRLPRSVPTPGDPKWIGALFLVGIAVALACVAVFVYLWVQEVNRGVGHVLLQSSLPPMLNRILWG